MKIWWLWVGTLGLGWAELSTLLRRRMRRLLVCGLAVSAVVGGVVPLGMDGRAVAAPASPGRQGSTVTDGASALTEDAAAAKAASTGKDVEITSLRSESSETYATTDGRLEVVEHVRPVRARVSGGWKPVDNTLVAAGDGTVVPKVTTVGFAFSGGGAGPMVSLVTAGKELAYTWPTPLPVPALDGDTATYRNVLPDVDLQMRADTDGFHQLLVVRTPQAAKNPALVELKLGVQSSGLRLSESAQGGLEARDESGGGLAFEAPKPVMWDSSMGGATPSAAHAPATLASASPASASPEPANAGPGDASNVAPIDVEVTEDGSELHLTPSQSMLTGANTTFPVFIDPETAAPHATSWTMVSRYWASSPQWRFNGDSDAGTGYCGWDYCAPYDLKRVMYQFPTTKFVGKSIISATFVAHETHSASCTAEPVELWRTKYISSSTTWDTQTASGFWIQKQDFKSVAFGGPGCSAGDVEFNAKPAVSTVGSNTTVTFGLKATNEDDKYGWKRFSDDAYLRVKYNLPPKQIPMSSLSMNPGGSCKLSAVNIRTIPSVFASEVTDPDGDKVSVQFQLYWDAGDGKHQIARWTSPRSTAKASGSNFSLTLPSTIPKDTVIGWAARAVDYDEGTAYSNSPWSWEGSATACYFRYDPNAPSSPQVGSGDYPPVNDADPQDPSYDGVGRYGAFTVSSTDTGVTKYWYGVNTDPSSANQVVTTQGAAKTISFRPTKSGVNKLLVSAFDAAGNQSAPTTYLFKVKAGQPARAEWQLDDTAGTTTAAGKAGERTLDVHGNPILGAPGAVGDAVTFDGADDYLQSDIPTVTTSASFSVAAWVKLSKMPDTAAIIAAQPGNHSPGFELYYSKDLNRWAFNQYTADTAAANPVRAMQAAPGGVNPDEWVHLTGVYDSLSKTLGLYVNGVLAGTTSYTTAWDARRGLQIGSGSYDGQPGSFFPGTIDDVRIYDRALNAADIAGLYDKQPVTGRPTRAVFPLDEPAVQDNGQPTTQIHGSAEVESATLKGGAQAGQPGVYGNALNLDGVDDYAATASPHLNTLASFSVTAWARMSVKPGQAAIVATQAGTYRPSFELYYSASFGWTFNQYSADSTSASLVRATQGDTTKSPAGVWTQLTGTYDAVTHQLQLYINGSLVSSVAAPSPFYGAGPVQIGAGSYSGVPSAFFPGQIDDVQLYDRALSAPEVSDLYQSRPVVEGRWKLDSATGTPSVSPDDTANTADRHALTLGPGASVSADPSDKYIGTGGLKLDGKTGYAATAASPIHTNTSFTVTAWVNSPGRPDRAETLFSQAGTKNSGFTVRYVPDATDPGNAGQWQLDMASTDDEHALHATAEHSDFQENTWTNVAVVYDAFTAQMRLYVNGELRQSVCADDDGDGSQDDPTCTTKVSWNSDAHPFDATKGLQLGRSLVGGTFGEYWSGAIDDVWALQGAASDDQIAQLASGIDIPTSSGP